MVKELRPEGAKVSSRSVFNTLSFPSYCVDCSPLWFIFLFLKTNNYELKIFQLLNIKHENLRY